MMYIATDRKTAINNVTDDTLSTIKKPTDFSFLKLQLPERFRGQIKAIPEQINKLCDATGCCRSRINKQTNPKETQKPKYKHLKRHFRCFDRSVADPARAEAIKVHARCDAPRDSSALA